MSDYFHPDVLTNILARLHIKTLLRCTLVCQSWYSLIKSHDFAIAHLNLKKPEGLFLIRSLTIQNGDETYAFRWDNERLSKYEEFDIAFRPAYNNKYRVIASCNGVLCFSDFLWHHRNKVILWNPAIRKCLRLPHQENAFRDHEFSRVIGFGFDSDSNDYKVVRITNYHGIEVLAEVCVYSLSSQTWRTVSHLESKLQFLGPSAPQVFTNGTLHWIVSDARVKKNNILSFKLSTEEFHTLELPSTIPSISLSRFRLYSTLKPAVIEGTLALVESGRRRCRIWLMENYGVWTKKVDVSLNKDLAELIGVRNNGKLLVEKTGALYSYDPRFTEEWQLCLYTGFDASSFLSRPSPHFPIQKEVNRLKINSKYSVCQYSVEEAFYIENYQESLVLLGMQADVGEYATDSEDEEETYNEEEETESESEDDEEETESESEDEETGSDSEDE